MKASKQGTKVSLQILEEASGWFVEFSEGNVDASGRAEFDAWLRRSPEHIQAYLQIAALWESASLLEKGRTLGSDEIIARAVAEGNVLRLTPPGASAARVAHRSVQFVAAEQSRPAIGSRLRRLAMAATVLITIVGSAAWYQLYRAPIYTTAVGEQRSIRLSDGSMVQINSRSKLRVRFAEHERRVELLEGEAIFEVAKDHNRPFLVDADETKVRAVGTRFNVYRRRSGTIVTVLEGRVAVGSPLIDNPQPGNGIAASLPVPEIPDVAFGNGPSSSRNDETDVTTVHSHPLSASVDQAPARNGSQQEDKVSSLAKSGELLLVAGQRLIVSPIARSAPEPANIEAATAWTRREIVFQTSPLNEVIEEFNRYNPKMMVIADPAIENIRISGVFSSTDPNSLLRFLSDLPNFKVRETADEIRISSE